MRRNLKKSGLLCKQEVEEVGVSAELPNKLTTGTLRESAAGKGLKQFRSRKELYADLGL
jgi:hypothetical protein